MFISYVENFYHTFNSPICIYYILECSSKFICLEICRWWFFGRQNLENRTNLGVIIYFCFLKYIFYLHQYPSSYKKTLIALKLSSIIWIHLWWCKYRAPSLSNKTFFCHVITEHIQSMVNSFFLSYLKNLGTIGYSSELQLITTWNMNELFCILFTTID